MFQSVQRPCTQGSSTCAAGLDAGAPDLDQGRQVGVGRAIFACPLERGRRDVRGDEAPAVNKPSAALP